MLRGLVFAFVLSAVSAPAISQTVEGSFDTAALGWGPLDTPQSIETDGNPTTREWLVRNIHTSQYRVLAITPDGRLCAGAWFSGIPSSIFLAVTTVQTVGGLSKFVSRDWAGRVTIMRIDTPACD